MNFCLIMTDTQNKSMVGAYGQPAVDTPHLDRLAETGLRFERAYTTCPLCTPARSGLFTGTHPPVNGAWCNNIAPSSSIPLLGTIFSQYGYRAAYTGKWHLDGSGYFGDGVPGGGKVFCLRGHREPRGNERLFTAEIGHPPPSDAPIGIRLPGGRQEPGGDTPPGSSIERRRARHRVACRPAGARG